MEVVTSIAALNSALQSHRLAKKNVGFVPTMGALHEGHMALIRRAKKENDLVVASIFVNPTQFTNASDLELYPRTPEKDVALLAENGCDIAFFPTAEMIYPSDYKPLELDLGNLETVMEGEFRPGHFKGVVQVVNRFFELIQPNFAYFGLKDFQQVAVIQHLVRSTKSTVTIVPCETLRETSGLAMSSRNMRLSPQQLSDAVCIYQTLLKARELAKTKTPNEVQTILTQEFEGFPLQLEYLTIVEPKQLLPLTDSWTPGATACIAAYCGEVRLIDNLVISQ